MGGGRGATRRDVAGAVAVLGVGGEQAGVVPLLHDDEGDLWAVVAAGLEILARGVDLRAGAARVGGPPDMVPTHDTPNRMQGVAGWASGRSSRATGGRGGREGGGRQTEDHPGTQMCRIRDHPSTGSKHSATARAAVRPNNPA